MQAEDRIRLQHMVEAVQAARQFMTGRDRAALDQDQMLLFAVARALEIVGEAATRVSAETRAANAAVPWAAIIGMRNRMVHAYFSIDHEIVWQTVSSELPRLLPVLQAALDRP